MPILSVKKRRALKPVVTLARFCYYENYSAAEKLLLEVINDLNIDGDWGLGITSAVKGMINAGREGDQASFYWRCKNANVDELKMFREELVKDLSRDNITDFEHGFINAWITIIDEFINIIKEREKKS